mgnify:CR=1 FL=1
MNLQEYTELVKVLDAVEKDPEALLFMINEAVEEEPYIKIPLGDSRLFDGYLIIHPDGWFLHKDGE